MPPFPEDIDCALWDNYGKFKHWPSKKEVVRHCIETFDLTLTASKHTFLAVHEAGHALMAMKTGLPMKGIRFHDAGDSGVTVLLDVEWKHSTDVRRLNALIAIDVAGVVAERLAKVLRPDADEPLELLSTWYDGRLAGNPPTPLDFQLAHHRAHQLDSVVSQSPVRPVRALNDPAGWPAKKAILESAEKTVEVVLAKNMEVLQNLADSLKEGPMITKAIKRLVGKLK